MQGDGAIRNFQSPAVYAIFLEYLCIQILNPLFQPCKLMHTQNDKFPDHFTRGWVAYTQVKSDWRCFFHTLISDTRRVRCVRKMSDLNLRYGSRKYFNPGHFYVTRITDRASLYYFARWNLFWKYTYMFFFFFNFGNCSKLWNTEKWCMKSLLRKKKKIELQIFESL